MSQNNYKLKIVESLLRAENHIRGLAKSLHTNQTMIARKVQELAQENIVDFRQEGRNKVTFIKKTLEGKQYAFAVEAARLVEAAQKYPDLRRIIELVKKNNAITLAILFGSFAKGIANKNSDIDMYIDTTDKKLKEKIELLDSRINVKIGEYNKDSLLIKEIEKNHVIIKGVELFYEKNKFFD